jgi:signal transduction histidine kinase/DNA-binding response OmpR family regulator
MVFCASRRKELAMEIFLFQYFPQDKLIINEDSTVEAYQCKQVYTDMPYSFIDEFVDEEYREKYIQVYREIDAGAKKASVLFRMKNREDICKVTLVTTVYTADGRPEQVLGIVENETEVVQKELENQRQMEIMNETLRRNLKEQQAMSEELTAMLDAEKEHTAIIGGLSSIYFAIYQLDFEELTFQELFTKENIHATLGVKGDARDALTGMVEKLILPETQDVMRAFNEITTMPERIGDKKIITQDYIGLTTGWSQASIIPNAWNREAKPIRALYCTRKIGDEKEKMELQKNLISALIVNYQDVYVVNMDTGISSAYRMSSVMALEHGEKFAAGDYEKNLAIYIKDAVYTPDRKMFEKVRTIDAIQKIFEKQDRFAFTYREYQNGRTVYFQYQLIKPSKKRNEFIAVLKDVDDEMREEIRHAKETNEQLGVIQALSNKYDSVFFINLKDGKAIPYHLSNEKMQDYGEHLVEAQLWDEIVKGYAQNGVDSGYAQEFVEKVSLENLSGELSKKSSFVYEYKDSDAQESRFYQLKAVSGTDTDSIIVGISNVDEERRQQILVQKAMQDAYAAASAANNAKTNFLTSMSHDIRTPMNAIIGMTAIAATHIDDRERVQDCLKKITASSKHLLSLVNEVLDMSKIESGKIDLDEEDFNLSDLIDNVLTMVRPQIEEHRHELVVNIKDVEHEQVVGDSLRIQQLFVNLMSNAIKYTPDGGKITLSLTEKKANQRRAGFYEVTVEDNGIGMSEEFLNKLFEPFARAQDERIRNVQGTGLGMVISRNIVNMMGGNIEVESQLNKGTKFTVTFFLKLRDVEEAAYDDFIDLPVLVADDDEISMESACCMLDGFGMKTEGVLSGEEAVKRVIERHERREDYFAVILDWKMPGMDGVEATRKIRQTIGEDVLIIIISAYDWSEIEQEARQAGVNAFISKPLFKSRLEHLFHSLLGKEEEVQELVPLKKFEKMDLSAYRVLLVEDNELNAEIATEILGLTGIKVDVANDGSVAVDMIRERGDIKYDIIFMDIQMPKMNGYDATRAIRNLGCDYCKSVPIIAMTANAFAEDVQAAFSAGMNEHIAKPLDLQTLWAVLDKWVVSQR